VENIINKKDIDINKFANMNRRLLALELILLLINREVKNVISEENPAKIPMSTWLKLKYSLTKSGSVVINALFEALTAKVNEISIIME
jgi:hypothetical protein